MAKRKWVGEPQVSNWSKTKNKKAKVKHGKDVVVIKKSKP